MNLPKKVARGEIVTAEAYNQIIDALQAIMVMPGKGYRRRISRAGTSLQIVPPGRPQTKSDHPPFAMISVEEEEEEQGGGWKITLEPGRVRSANPVQAANEGDGYDYLIPEINGKPMDFLDGEGNLPSIAIQPGEWIYCKIERTDEGIIVPPCEIVVDEGEKESDHYQPPNPDEAGEPEVFQYVRILEFDIVEEEPEIRPWRESDIDIEPFLWPGENLGSGSRPFKKHNAPTGRWQFRTHSGCYGAEVKEEGDEILHQFDGENGENMDGGMAAAVLVERTEEEIEEEPCVPAKFRRITQGPVERREIQVREKDDTIQIMGNSKSSNLRFEDCFGNPIFILEWTDGLITNQFGTIIKVPYCDSPSS